MYRAEQSSGVELVISDSLAELHERELLGRGAVNAGSRQGSRKETSRRARELSLGYRELGVGGSDREESRR